MSEGLLVAKFLQGFIDSRKKKKKEELANKKAEDKITKDDFKKEVEFYKEMKSQAGDNTEIRNYAEEMLLYLKGVASGKSLPRPTMTDAVRQYLGEDETGTIFNPANIDPESDVGKKYEKAQAVLGQWNTYFNSLDGATQQQVNQRRISMGLKYPTVETIMEDLDRYESSINSLTGKKTAIESEVKAEKEDVDRLQAVSDEYISGLKSAIENDIAEIEAYEQTQLKRQQLKEGAFNLSDESINAINMINNFKKTSITKIADDRTLESLTKKLMMFKELTGKTYDVSNSVWDNPLFRSDFDKNVDLDVNSKNRLLSEEFRGQDNITLKEYMSGFYVDENTTSSLPVGALKLSNYNDLEKLYPEIFEHINIISKEQEEFDAVNKKRDKIYKDISKMRNSLLNVNFAKLGFKPSMDNRDKIIDNREDSETKGQLIDNPGKGTPMMGFPYYQDDEEE